MTDSFGIPIYELGLKQWVYSTGPLYKSLCGRLSILETAEVIRRAKLFIGIDSGPAHLANAVGTFGIIMLGNYLGFERYNPFSGGFCDGSKAVLLFGTGSVETIQVDSVFAKVEQHLDQT